MPAHFFYIKTGMGQVATAAATDPHFRQQFRGFFQQGHFQQRIHPGCIHGTEKSGSPPSDYDQFFSHVLFFAKNAEI
jgi:hypothetical protein